MASVDTRNVQNRRVVVHSSLRGAAHSSANRERAEQLVWNWVGSKWPRLIPSAEDMKRDTVRCSAPGQELSVARGDADAAARWTLALAHRDGKGNRTWMTEVLVSDDGDADLVRVQTSCIGDPAAVVAPPRVLGLWVEHLDLNDGGFDVIGEPRFVDSTEQAQAFCAHVLSDKRSLPVIALMTGPHSRYYGVDPLAVAEAVRGLAHVACLPARLSGIVAERLGSDFVPVNGAARIYGPHFDTRAAPEEHPLIKPGRPRDRSRADDPGSFRRVLIQRVCAIGVDAAVVAERLEP